jgi:hypothetical protein
VKRFPAVIAAIALMFALVLPTSAGAKIGAVKWVCDVPGEGEVTFVSAPAAAEHGITQADSRAGDFAFAMFGEECEVRVDP